MKQSIFGKSIFSPFTFIAFKCLSFKILGENEAITDEVHPPANLYLNIYIYIYYFVIFSLGKTPLFCHILALLFLQITC